MSRTVRLGFLCCVTVLGLLPGIARAQGTLTLEQRVTALETLVAALQATVTAQASQIANLQTTLERAHNVLALSPFVTVTPDERYDGAVVRFTRVNLQLVNGAGGTATRNGFGNLLIGYDESRTTGTPLCADGRYPDQTSCAAALGAGGWALSHKTGSHYLIVGPSHNYSQYGGLVVGYQNTSNAPFTSVSGGVNNTASASFASVSGGNQNTASGNSASVSGGTANVASLGGASVSGGAYNTASGLYASVSGGTRNTASTYYATVSGGTQLKASTQFGWAAGVYHTP